MNVMKRLAPGSDQSDDSVIDMTPMLDVVFILLIFFIVTASFVKESGIEVNKPSAKTAVTQERATILVAIDQDNDVWIDRRKVDVRAVRANIERLHAENPLGTLVIQADSDSTNVRLVQVMDAAHQAGIYQIAISAKK